MKEKDFIKEFKENYRVGDIELRKTKRYNNDTYYLEIVKMYPNSFFGKETEFIWDDMKNMYRYTDDNHCFVDESCFKNRESCCTIASVKFSKTDEEPDIISVGSRTATLSDLDWLDYKKVLKYFYDYYYQINKDDE